MADRDVVTRAGKGSELSSADYDQNVKSHDGTVEEQTGATYTVVYTDQNKTIELNNASMVCTLTAIATIAGQIDTDNFKVTLVNTNAAEATISRSGTDTIGPGATSIKIAQNQSITLQTDTTDAVWRVIGGNPQFFIGTHTTASLASGASEEITITHGLGTDDVDFGFSMVGNDATNISTRAAVIGFGMRPDGAHVTNCLTNLSSNLDYPASEPSTGDIVIVAKNIYAASQTIDVNYWIRVRS